MAEFVQERLQKFNALADKYRSLEKQQEPATLKVTTPDGAEHEFDAGTTYMNIAKKLVKASSIYSKFVAVIVDDKAMDLSQQLKQSCKLRFVSFEDPEGKQVFWHSSAHVLGAVLEKLYGGHLGHGPATESGFFYDCYIPTKQAIDQQQLDVISQECKQFVTTACQAKDSSFVRLSITREEALDLFSYSALKQELIRDHVGEGETCTVYRCGNFVDFCRGPHVPDLGRLKAFKALSCSAAYFKADQSRESMQRVYGVSFPSEKELKEHLERLEELRRRDHRVVGQQMDLFMMHRYAPGMPLFCPNGTVVYRRLEGFVRELLHKYHYKEVMTPTFLNTELWETSGHLAHYRENMFLLEQRPGEPLYGLKPMNCPAHCLLYRAQHRARAELPLRLAEFGVVHRNELSGALSGLTRVCRFEQDDAHVFCAQDQIQDEVGKVVEFLKEAYTPFGLQFSLALALRPAERIGDDAVWDAAEAALRAALVAAGQPYTECPGDGAFYGPKIDVRLVDALGRPHQCGTVQLDFNLPVRFDLQYADYRDGRQVYDRPVMIHRAILGSLERFMAIILENCAGRLPFWLSPRQVVVVPVCADFAEYAEGLAERVHQAGFEAVADLSAEKMTKKIAVAYDQHYNFICVVGRREHDQASVTVQGRSLAAADGVTEHPEKHSRFMAADEFITLLCRLRDGRKPV